MPRKCCVPGCRGNYKTTASNIEEKVSVFTFPADDELRAKWIKAIPRKDLQVTKQTVVCEKHFMDYMILRVDSITKTDGSILTAPRKIPKLSPDAYPSIFPNTPSYLTTEVPLPRSDPEERRRAVDLREQAKFDEWVS